MLQYDLVPYAKRINDLRCEVEAHAKELTLNKKATMRWMIDGENELVPTFIVMKVKESEIRQLEIEAIGILD